MYFLECIFQECICGGMIPGCISYHPMHHHPAKTAASNFQHWNSDEERRGEERHQQKWNQQEPLQNEIWYEDIMDKMKRDHPIKAPMDLATTHKLTLAIVNLAEKRDHMRWANETNCYLGLKGEGPICNKLVPIMHAAVLSVRGGDGLIWRKRSLRRTKTSQMPEKIFVVILS